MEITSQTVDFVKGWEGCRLEAYQDQRGKWTIGYGQTGPDIHEGTVWSQDEADEKLTDTLTGISHWLGELVRVSTNSNQDTALISLAYNIGYGDLKTSALLRFLNKGEYSMAANQFPLWNKVNGYVDHGLTRRREAERVLFCRKCQ
jgi:lysozyme